MKAMETMVTIPLSVFLALAKKAAQRDSLVALAKQKQYSIAVDTVMAVTESDSDKEGMHDETEMGDTAGSSCVAADGADGNAAPF